MTSRIPKRPELSQTCVQFTDCGKCKILTRRFSDSFVIMTTRFDLSCQIIRHRSLIVSGLGPAQRVRWVRMNTWLYIRQYILTL